MTDDRTPSAAKPSPAADISELEDRLREMSDAEVQAAYRAADATSPELMLLTGEMERRNLDE